MTRKQGNKRENGLPTGGQADQKREGDISAATGEDSGGSLDIMDTAVIAMVNLYLKNISSSERYIILKNVVSPSTERAEIESGIKAHIDGAKLADLIDKAKAYLAESLNVRRTAHSTPHEEQPVETVFGVDMSNTSQHGMIMPGMIYSSDGVDTDSAKLKGRVVSVDDIDDDAPKYNPELEMSFNNLINKSWEVLFDLMKGLSGVEYVTHMPYEMAEMITDYYYKLP